MDEHECIHGMRTEDCAACASSGPTGRGTGHDRTGHEKLLVFCPEVTDDSLLHFNRQGDSYRLRAYVGRLAGRQPWTEPDAPTADAFLRIHPPVHRIDVAPEQVAVDRPDRWRAIISEHNRRLGIPLG